MVFLTGILIALLSVIILSNGTTIPCQDDACLELRGTEHFACCSGLTLRAYCLQKFEQHAVFTDGACDKYLPTRQPTKRPTLQPTRFFFPTQSPQTQAEYNSYLTKAPNSEGSSTDSEGSSGKSSSSDSPVAGLAAGVACVLAIFGGVIYVRRYRRKKHNALHEAEFGVGASSRMPVRQEYGMAMT